MCVCMCVCILKPKKFNYLWLINYKISHPNMNRCEIYIKYLKYTRNQSSSEINEISFLGYKRKTSDQPFLQVLTLENKGWKLEVIFQILFHFLPVVLSLDLRYSPMNTIPLSCTLSPFHYFFYERGSHLVVQAGSELVIILPEPPR